jgi:hypothetical protein
MGADEKGKVKGFRVGGSGEKKILTQRRRGAEKNRPRMTRIRRRRGFAQRHRDTGKKRRLGRDGGVKSSSSIVVVCGF